MLGGIESEIDREKVDYGDEGDQTASEYLVEDTLMPADNIIAEKQNVSNEAISIFEEEPHIGEVTESVEIESMPASVHHHAATEKKFTRNGI